MDGERSGKSEEFTGKLESPTGGYNLMFCPGEVDGLVLHGRRIVDLKKVLNDLRSPS